MSNDLERHVDEMLSVCPRPHNFASNISPPSQSDTASQYILLNFNMNF